MGWCLEGRGVSGRFVQERVLFWENINHSRSHLSPSFLYSKAVGSLRSKKKKDLGYFQMFSFSV